MIDLREVLSTIIVLTLVILGLAVFAFAVVGVVMVWTSYKTRNWQEQYGDKLDEEAERNRWEERERLSDRVFLLEEAIKQHGIEGSMDEINRALSEVDYNARYDAWRKVDGKRRVYALSSVSGGFGSRDKAQADIDEDFDRYEEQIKQSLREQLQKRLGKDA